MIDLEAFVLIGGRSSRLGRDKAFVELGGVSLAERAAAAVEEAFADVDVTYVAASGSQFPSSAIATLSRPVISDLRPGCGAWSGLHAALASAHTEWTLVLACDYPFVTPALLRLLGDMASERYDAVVPVQPDGRLQPLCSTYQVRPVLSKIETAMDAGGELPPLRLFLSDELTRIVGEAEYASAGDVKHLFLNINTQHDLECAASDMAK